MEGEHAAWKQANGDAAKGTGSYEAAFVADAFVTISRDDSLVRWWSVKDGAAGKTFDTKFKSARGLAASPDATLLAVTDGSANVVVFDRDGAEKWRQNPSNASQLAFSPDGKRLAVGEGGGGAGVRVVSAGDGKDKVTLATGGKGHVVGLQWLDNARLACCADRSGGLVVIETDPSKQPRVVAAALEAERDADRAIVVCGQGRVAVLDKDKVIHLCKVD